MSVVTIHPGHRGRWTAAALGTVLGLIVAGAGCRSAVGTGEADGGAATPASVADLRVVTFTAEEIQHGGVTWSAVEAMVGALSVEVPGQLLADENRTVHISAPAQGRLLTLRVNVGDRVVHGQVLATMQSEAAASARADHAKAVAELASRQTAAAYARMSLERAERLLDLKAGSRQDVERTRTDDAVAQGAVVQAQAEVDRAKTALTHLNVDDRGDIVLRSTLTGVVLTRDAVPGAVIEPGATLLAITDPRSLWLKVAATEALAAALRPGAKVRFTVPAYPGEPFEARVQNIAGAFDPATRTLPVRAIVANTGGRLRPEMFATVRVEQGAVRSGVGVPDTAVQLLDERPVVFVATPQGGGGATFERRDVELGAREAGRTQVVGGIAPGDLVVTEGAFAVKSQFSRATLP